MVFGWIKGMEVGELGRGWRIQDIGRSCNTFHSCTHNYARCWSSGGVMAGLPWIRGLSEVWHSKIEKPKFKLGQLFEFMTKWHTLSHGIRMGMHVKTIKDQPIPHI